MEVSLEDSDKKKTEGVLLVLLILAFLLLAFFAVRMQLDYNTLVVECNELRRNATLSLIDWSR